MAGSNKLRAGNGSRNFRLPATLPAERMLLRAEPATVISAINRCIADRPSSKHKNPPTQTPDYADLFEHAPVGYMLLDASGCIEKINCKGAAILGWDAPRLAGKPFSRWVTDNDKPLFLAHLHNVIHCKNCIRQELRIENRQGLTVSLRLESVPEEIHPHSAIGCRSIMIDISGEQQSTHKLRYLQSQLNHLARLHTVGELASSLAHELNQPLGTVLLNCEVALRLLKSGAGEEYEIFEALTQATEAASFASGIVRHLHGFLRNTDELHTVCNLYALVMDVSPLIEADARNTDIELKLDIEPSLPPIRVDPVQIEQVVLNLAHNSIEAMREKAGGLKQVTINARRQPPNNILVSVTDNGPGLNAKQLSLMFTPFYTTKSNGMGMGLSISRTIIEAHGGKLWATAEAGKGATVCFTLPTIGPGQHAD